MRSTSKFTMKGLEKREGGTFTNEKGQAIQYGESCVLKVDEQTEKGIFERKLKFPTTDVVLIEKLKKIQAYAPINLTCDINFFGNTVKVTPIDVTEIK